jgi:hypothetical protein
MRLTYPELFSQPDESKRAEKTLELAIHRDKSKILTNTLELVLSRTIQTRVEIKSIQDLNRQESEASCSPKFMTNKQYRKKTLKGSFLTRQYREGLILRIIIKRRQRHLFLE